MTSIGPQSIAPATDDSQVGSTNGHSNWLPATEVRTDRHDKASRQPFGPSSQTSTAETAMDTIIPMGRGGEDQTAPISTSRNGDDAPSKEGDANPSKSVTFGPHPEEGGETTSHSVQGDAIPLPPVMDQGSVIPPPPDDDTSRVGGNRLDSSEQRVNTNESPLRPHSPRGQSQGSSGPTTIVPSRNSLFGQVSAPFYDNRSVDSMQVPVPSGKNHLGSSIYTRLGFTNDGTLNSASHDSRFAASQGTSGYSTFDLTRQSHECEGGKDDHSTSMSLTDGGILEPMSLVPVHQANLLFTDVSARSFANVLQSAMKP